MRRSLWLPALVAFLGIVANIVMDVLTGARLIGPQYGFLFYVARVIALIAAVFPGLFAIVKAEIRESARKWREQRDYLAKVLEASVRRLFPSEDPYLIRANVMVVKGDQLRVLCGWNMEAYPDSGMSLSYGKGVAGKVWKRATTKPLNECWQPIYAPEAQLEREDLIGKWALSDEEIEKTAHILWILSTPLLYRRAEHLQFLGCLNLDGVTRPLDSMEVFESREFHLRCVAVADRVADLIMEGDLLTSI